MTTSSNQPPPGPWQPRRRRGRGELRERRERIAGPEELVQAVPYLLGFHPAASLVLVGLAAGRLVVTARLDLADAARPEILVDTVRALTAGGSEQFVALVYDDAQPMPDGLERQWPLAGDVADAAEAYGCEVLDILLVVGGRWRSLGCADPCCPADGRSLPVAPSPFAAAATVEGVVALPSRALLERLLDPLRGDELDASGGPPDEALLRAETAATSGALAAPGQRAVKRALFAAARAADEGWPAGRPDPDEIARFALALRSTAVRDAVWMAVDDGRLDGRELWRDLARRLPAPYDAAPAFLYGWANWRAGNGALANIAASRAVASDPDYTAADLLLAALSRGVDPRRFPRLRLSRSA